MHFPGYHIRSASRLLLLTLLTLSFFSVQAQLCQGSLGDPIVKTTFGSGSNPGSPLQGTLTNYQFVSMDCPTDGQYTVRNNTLNCFGSTWHSVSQDHTGDGSGYFMLVNASTTPGDFYVDTIRGLCSNTTFEFAAWIMNVLKPSSCNGAGNQPNITFTIEKVDGTMLKQYNSGSIASANVPEWKQYGFFFTMPAGVRELVIRMRNNAPGGCGNDLLLDDITFRPCGPSLAVSMNNSPQTSLDLCKGASASVTFTGTIPTGYTQPVIQWQESTNSGLSWNDIAGAGITSFVKTFNPLTPVGAYQYRMTVIEGENLGTNACRVASQVLTVRVNENPKTSATANGPVCSGTGLVLSATGGVQYSWTGPNNYSATGPTVIIGAVGASQAGKYYVSVTDALGCSALDSTLVAVIQSPEAVLEFDDTTVCRGTPITLRSSGGATYTWTPSEGLSSGKIANPVALPLVTTRYQVVIGEGACFDTGYVNVAVLEAPTADAGPDRILIEGQSVTLLGQTGGGAGAHSWEPPVFMNDPALLQPTVNPPADFIYVLQATSNNGCGTDRDTVFVKVYPNIKIPNVFTPNGDGVNDTWQIEALEAYPTFELLLFNRYGQLIFTSKSAARPWDGKVAGRPVPTGTYYFTLDLKQAGLKHSGFVDVIR